MDSDPLVTGVGGTQLRLTPSGRRTAPDRVWNDSFNSTLNQLFFGSPGPNAFATGGGQSVIFSKPGYQARDGIAGNRRGIPESTARSLTIPGLADQRSPRRPG